MECRKSKRVTAYLLHLYMYFLVGLRLHAQDSKEQVPNALHSYAKSMQSLINRRCYSTLSLTNNIRCLSYAASATARPGRVAVQTRRHCSIVRPSTRYHRSRDREQVCLDPSVAALRDQSPGLYVYDPEAVVG